MVSEDCIYLRHNDDDQIWIDYGSNGELRDFYYYYKNMLIFKSQFSFYNGSIFLRTQNDKKFTWKYKKNNDDDKNSIIINNNIYYVNKNNKNQVNLFNEFLEYIFLDDEYNFNDDVYDDGDIENDK